MAPCWFSAKAANVGVESLISGAEEDDAHVVACKCDNNICGPPDSGQEAHTSEWPSAPICPPVVERARSELACGGSLHARTNRMCVLSENHESCDDAVLGSVLDCMRCVSATGGVKDLVG